MEVPNRRIGKNMKSRGSAVVPMRSGENPVSFEVENEAQTESELNQQDTENGINPETPVFPGATPLTVDGPIDPKKADDGFVAVTPPVEGDSLADLMRKSAEHNEADISAGMANLLGEPAKHDIMDDVLGYGLGSLLHIPTKEEIEALEQGQVIPVPGVAQGIGMTPPRATSDDFPAWPERTETHMGTVVNLGEQPDGTFKIVVTIPEGYIESIRQQAEVDHETIEEWASKNYSEYLEGWWSPPRNA